MEKKLTAAALNDLMRDEVGKILSDALNAADKDVLVVGNGKYAVPMVNANGDESWAVISIAIPKGTRDGDPYDGYSAAQEYDEHQKEKARKAVEAAKLKAEKAAERERLKAEKAAKKEREKAEKEKGE